MSALSEFNALSAEEATQWLTPVLDLPSWVATLVAARPFASVESVLDLADATPWTDAELAATVAGRPRLGGAIPPTNSFSPGEQAGVRADAERDALSAAYEARFGMIFLIRAAGRTAEETLAEMKRRLGNEPAGEPAEVERELREITRLRLEARLS
jgi:2-oxo-4-hydroxy-4-carboxy-5-ureidoimidazoline decarboxylase